MNALRRNLVALVSLLAVIGTLGAATALASDARPSGHHSSPRTDHELNGTWLTTVQLSDAPPGVPTSFGALDTFLPGGGVVVSSSAPMPSTRGLAHGSWSHVGHRNFTVTFTWFRFDASGLPVGTQRVRRTMNVSKSGTSFSGTDVIEIIAPTGAVLATIHGTETGTLLPG
jgi:hypothetical protein